MKQGLSPLSSVPAITERGYKTGLLVAEETVKGLEKHGRFGSIPEHHAIMLDVVPFRGVSNTMKRLKHMRVIQSPFVSNW